MKYQCDKGHVFENKHEAETNICFEAVYTLPPGQWFSVKSGRSAIIICGAKAYPIKDQP